MWLRKLYSKFNYWLSQTYHPDNTGQAEKLGILESLDPLLFADYKTVYACVFKIKVVYPCLDDYIKQLRYVSYILDAHIGIDNHWCKYNWSEVSLDAFLINEKGLHLDPVKSIAEFKRSSLKFFHQYALIREAQIDDDGHNARILAKFLNTILELAGTLLRYSHGRPQQEALPYRKDPGISR